MKNNILKANVKTPKKGLSRFQCLALTMIFLMTATFGTTGCAYVEDAISDLDNEFSNLDNDFSNISDILPGIGSDNSDLNNHSDMNSNSTENISEAVPDPNIVVKTLQEELSSDTYGLLYPVKREAYVGRKYYQVSSEEDLVRAVADGLSKGIRGIVLQYDSYDYKYWENLLEKNKNCSEFGGYLNAGMVTDYSVKGELGVYPSFNEAWQAMTYYRYKEPEIGENTMKLLETAHKLAENAVKVSPNDEVGMLKYINEQICKMTKYSDPIPSGLGVPQRDATGVFFNGDAVCAGYATAFALVLNILGIENRTLNNDEKPESANAHIWNYVKVNGSWYHIDATWNDNSSDNTAYMNEYFMLTDDELKKKDSSTAHKWTIHLK